MRANIQAVSLKIQTLKSNNSMAQAMKGVTKAMGTMNRQVGIPLPIPLPINPQGANSPSPYFQLKLPQIQKIMMEFERQAEIMDMKEEMMNDAIDDAMGDEEDEEERCGEKLKGGRCFSGPHPCKALMDPPLP
jgi:charged multivesicular body protein 2A